MKEKWVCINDHIFNIDKVTDFAIELKCEPFEEDPRDIYQVKANFGGGLAYDKDNEHVIDDSCILAEVMSKDAGFEIVKDIIEGKYPYQERRTTPPIPELEKEEKDNKSNEVPF